MPTCSTCSAIPASGRLLLSEAGARLVHVDASKKSVEAGKDNAALSGMADRPIRWIVDDAGKFTAREVRRGRRYDGILLDPPKFGRGPEGEMWRLEEHLAPLLADCRKLLDGDSRFLVLTVYAVRMSALAIGELVRQALGDLGGRSKSARWRCARKRAACCCRPRSSRAGLGPRRPDRGRRRRTAHRRQGTSETAASSSSAPDHPRRERRLENQQRHCQREQQSPASDPARGNPAISAAISHRNAASPGVPTARQIRRARTTVESRPSRTAAGNAASSSSGANVSQCAAILAAAIALLGEAVKR